MAVTHPDSHLHRDEADDGRRWYHHAFWAIPLAALAALAVWAAVGFNQSQDSEPVLREALPATAPDSTPVAAPAAADASATGTNASAITAPPSAPGAMRLNPADLGPPVAGQVPAYSGNPGSSPNPPAVVDRTQPSGAL